MLVKHLVIPTLLVIAIGSLPNTAVYNAPVEPQNALQTCQTVESCVRYYFPQNYDVALAIAKAESSLNPTAINYNCRYNGVSTFCKKGDEINAWSVDCGIYQINTKGRVCPVDMFDIKNNIEQARKMYEARGWQPWVAYSGQHYKKYLE
jgi:hypothetical protein